MGQVLRTSLADSDLVQIGIHIAQDNPAAADETLSLIEAKCELLGQFPELGRKRDELAPRFDPFQ